MEQQANNHRSGYSIGYSVKLNPRTRAGNGDGIADIARRFL